MNISRLLHMTPDPEHDVESCFAEWLAQLETVDTIPQPIKERMIDSLTDLRKVWVVDVRDFFPDVFAAQRQGRKVFDVELSPTYPYALIAPGCVDEIIECHTCLENVLDFCEEIGVKPELHLYARVSQRQQ